MIFFDIDETLVDHLGAERDAVIAFQREYGASFQDPTEVFVERWHAVAEKHMQRYLAGELSFRGQRRARIMELFGGVGLFLTDDEADDCFASYLRHYEQNWRVFPDVETCLRALSSYPLGVISNGDAQQQRKKLDDLGLTSRFATIVISSELGVAKPHPGIFLDACSQAGLSPATCVYVGDQLETDARAAVQAGMRGIWLHRGGMPPATVEVPVITSLADLPKLIARITLGDVPSDP